MLSILTVSKRTGWYEQAYDSLARQRIELEWVIVQEGLTTADEYVSHTTHGMTIKMLAAPPKTRSSNLNKSLNHGLKFCSNEYVVFYQDFIVLEDDCLIKLIDLVDDNTFVGTVTKNEPGKPEDMRYLGADCPRPCRPDEWEANVAIAPMKAMLELGGFDEEYDDGWSWDNVGLADRAAMLGYKFILDESNRPQLLHHKKETDMPTNGEFHAQRMREIQAGDRPIKCQYL
jgi:hypothetical protein